MGLNSITSNHFPLCYMKIYFIGGPGVQDFSEMDAELGSLLPEASMCGQSPEDVAGLARVPHQTQMCFS